MAAGLVITRAQPFHNGHMKSVNGVLERGDNLIIAIGSAQESDTKRNPFTAGERVEMIDAALKYEKMSPYNYMIIPLMDTNPRTNRLWVAYTKLMLPHFDYVLTANPLVKTLYEMEGTDVLYIRRTSGIIGGNLRDLIAAGEKYEHLMPPGAVQKMKELHGEERIREIYQGDNLERRLYQ